MKKTKIAMLVAAIAAALFLFVRGQVYGGAVILMACFVAESAVNLSTGNYKRKKFLIAGMIMGIIALGFAFSGMFMGQQA